MAFGDLRTRAAAAAQTRSPRHRRRSPWTPAIAAIVAVTGAIAPAAIAQTPSPSNGQGDRGAIPCPRRAALDHLTAYTVRPGDTLASIAAAHNILPASILAFNESARDGRIDPGDRLQLPPFDGIRTRPEPGISWRDLARTYNLRPNALYEINGCTATPGTTAFIPGIVWSPTRDRGDVPSARDADNPLKIYPLPEAAAIAIGYGWTIGNDSDRPRFNSGIVLETAPGAIVQAAGPGTVAFAGPQDGYGNLIVINHPGGRQTRYGNLGTIAVKVGDRIAGGHDLGILAATARDRRRAYLTFEVRYSSPLGWVAQNPLPYLRIALQNALAPSQASD